MSRTVTVFDVMIASPSDVATERRVVREVITAWNDSHAFRSSVMLNPIGWDTHASPGIGRPRDLINTPAVEQADLLIAVFWTRLGTPTGKASSDTVEEIELHLSKGKPAMFYFSSRPVELSSIDPDQLAALQGFKTKLMTKSLVETFESPDELRQKLTAQLAHVVEKTLAPGAIAISQGTEVDMRSPPKLSTEAAGLLSEVANDRHGHVLKVRTMGGLTVQTNGKSFGKRGEGRSEALWDAAVVELRDKGLLEDRGQKGEVFAMTNEGYRVADLLATHK